MNRIILILSLGLLVCNPTYAQVGSTTNDKKTQRQINNILKSVNTYDSIPNSISTPSEFWQYIKDGDSEYADYLSNKSSFFLRTRSDFKDLVFASTDNQSKIDTTLNRRYSGGEYLLKGISIENEESVNACITPLGHIYITQSLLDIMTNGELMAILAHETAHFMLWHSEIEYFESKKSERANKIAAAISGAVVVAADAYAASEGVTIDPNTTAQNVVNLSIGFADNATRFKYRYSRENEIAADIAAVRFMEWQEQDGHLLVDALRKMANHGAKYGADNHSTTAYDSHPSLMFRISLLEALLKGNHKAMVKSNYKDPLYN